MTVIVTNRTPHVQRALDLLGKLQAFFADLVEFQHSLDPRVNAGQLSEAEATDVGFLHRELEELANEVRKECDARKELIGRVLAVMITRRSLENPGGSLSSQGEFATATPDIRVRPILPKHGTPEYATLMREFGVADEAVENGLVSPHRPRLSEWLTRLAESGRPAPKGLLGSRPEPQVTFRRRKRDKDEQAN